jgi:RNA polymerase sigma-70 factor (ECF subfamily)
MSEQKNDEHLVKAAVDGDRSAFDELAQRYRGAAFGVAFHRLGSFEAARDVAQEALIKAYQDLPTLREPSKFGNWLFRITVTAAAAYRRKSPYMLSLDLMPDRISDHAAWMERAEKARQVREALDVLPEADRLAVILHYVDGYSHEEIGDMLDSSVSAVKSRIYRARRRLREEMLEMVESNLKSELPKVEFTRDLAQVILQKYGENGGIGILNGLIVPADVEYTDRSKAALCRVALELADQGYSWLVAPPHIRDDDPLLGMLNELGFQVEMEMFRYQRSLAGALPQTPSLEPKYEIRGLAEADAGQVLTLLRKTANRFAPMGIDEDWVRRQLTSPDLMRDASLAAYANGQLAAIISVFKVNTRNPKYELGSAVIMWMDYDPEIGTVQLMQHLGTAALRAAGSDGIATISAVEISEHQAERIPVLEWLGFRRIHSIYNLKLNLKSMDTERLRAAISGPGKTPAGPTKSPRALRFSVQELPNEATTRLNLQISELAGTSTTVSVGEVYVVKGEYVYEGDHTGMLRLVDDGRVSGTDWPLVAGSHGFISSASIEQVNPGSEKTLYLNVSSGESGRITVLRIDIEGWA